MEDRKITLLKACKELLQKQDEAVYEVPNIMEDTLVYYDGAYCDGTCLLNDIKDLLAELED